MVRGNISISINQSLYLIVKKRTCIVCKRLIILQLHHITWAKCKSKCVRDFLNLLKLLASTICGGSLFYVLRTRRAKECSTEDVLAWLRCNWNLWWRERSAKWVWRRIIKGDVCLNHLQFYSVGESRAPLIYTSMTSDLALGVLFRI